MKSQPTKAFTLEKWVSLLRRGKSVYAFAELLRLTDLSNAAMRRALTRLCESELMISLGKGYYANGLQMPALEEIASVLYAPAYISLETALFMHGIVDQAPHLLTCVTINKTKIFRTGLGEIQYYHLKPELFFGYQINDALPLAEAEKAALDFVYLQRQNGLHPSLDEWNWEHLDLAKLRTYLEKFPHSVARHVAQFID